MMYTPNQAPMQMNDPQYKMDFQNQNDANMDTAMKLKKRQAMASMLEKQMQGQQAPNAMGGLSGIIGGLGMGLAEGQNKQDFQSLMKNGAFGGAGVGLSKYL